MATYPKIFYALVARERVVLCDGSHGQVGHFEQSSQTVLDGLSPAITMISYESSGHLYHIMVSNGLTYLCVSDRDFDRQIAFDFLKELEGRFISVGLQQRANYARPYTLRQEFGRIMDSLLEKYSTDYDDQLNRLQHEVNDLEGIMVENIEQVVRKSDNLNDLDDRVALIGKNTGQFLHSNERKKPFCGSHKMWMIIIATVLVVLLLIAVAVVITVLRLTGHLNKT